MPLVALARSREVKRRVVDTVKQIGECNASYCHRDINDLRIGELGLFDRSHHIGMNGTSISRELRLLFLSDASRLSTASSATGLLPPMRRKNLEPYRRFVLHHETIRRCGLWLRTLAHGNAHQKYPYRWHTSMIGISDL